MRHPAGILTLTAALFVSGCGIDGSKLNYGGGFPNNSGQLAPPVAVADSFSTLGGSILTASVTANDTVNGGTVTAFQNPSTAGGTVAITGTGQLTYTPPANAANVNDTFTYTLSNSGGASTATVSIAIGAKGFFVKNDVAATGTGSQASPFKTLAEAVTAASGTPGAQIVVFRGDGTATGQSTAVTLAANQAIVAQDPANQPTISAPITLAGNCTLANLRLIGAVGDAVTANGVVGGTLQNVTVANTTVNGLNLNNATGNFTLSGLVLANNGRAGLTLAGSTGTLNLTATNWTATNTVGNATEASFTGNAVVNASFDQMVFSQLGATNPILANSGSGFWWEHRNTSNVTLRVNNLRHTTGGAGLFIQSFDTSSSALVVTGVNVTDLIDTGIYVLAGDSSVFKTRISNCRLLGNLQGLRLGSALSSQLDARVQGNTSDTYRLVQSGASVFRVENYTNFASENVGTLSPAGTILNAAIDSLGIPE